MGGENTFRSPCTVLPMRTAPRSHQKSPFSRPSCCQLRAEGLYEDYDMARHQLGTNWALDQQNLKKDSNLGEILLPVKWHHASKMLTRQMPTGKNIHQHHPPATSAHTVVVGGRMISEGAPKKTVMITEDDLRGWSQRMIADLKNKLGTYGLPTKNSNLREITLT